MIHVELGLTETTLGAAALPLKLFSDNDGVARDGAN